MNADEQMDADENSCLIGWEDEQYRGSIQG